MARTVCAVTVVTLPAQLRDGLSILHRLHKWVTEHTSFAAAAWSDAAGTVTAACKLTQPARVTRVKQAIRRAVCGPDDVLHVEAVTNAQEECARVIDGAGGLAFSAPRPASIAGLQSPVGERAAEPKQPHTLLLHGLTLDDVLTGRHDWWSSQRAVGVLRPLPVSRALETVAAHVDTSAMLPVQHACESPDTLAERFEWPARLVGIAREDLEFVPTPGCPLCWRNANLRKALGPGHVRAAIPALYAAGYDAGHLLLRHAEHGLARAITDLVHEPEACQQKKRKRARRE
jgi:hypothetical protein